MKDRIGYLMRSMENGIDSSYDMEGAFEDILDEIIDNVIESMCFDVHRAVHFGYFSVEEYCIRDRKVEVYEERVIEIPEGGDIFGYINKYPQTTECPICNQRKGLRVIKRHMIACKTKHNCKDLWDLVLERERMQNNSENNIENHIENNIEDGSSSDGNDSVDSSEFTTEFDEEWETDEENMLR